ncbi:carboxylesterase/lipase family protein [Mycolicibacterium thermoresistibile]
MGSASHNYHAGVTAVVERSPIADTPLGRLRGSYENVPAQAAEGVAVWRGVPYARQPVGDLRFRAPEPPRPWSGVRDAVEPAPIPPQGRSFVGGGKDDPRIRDEACLTLTVWSPDPGGSLPVMVWIPGGAFVYGAGHLQLYNGSRLAANGNVVVVNVTYRLGVFGGFELSGLGAGFDDNLALRDQVAALRWVRDNIAAFGGDPGRVTVFGESAGATSVLALLASPAARGLFHRAIAQSPALPLIADADLRAGRAARFVERLGVGVDDIRELPQRALRRAAGLVQLDSIADSPALAYGLTHGVDLLPRHPIAAARAGTVHPVPLIIGTNSDEASMFAWGRPPMLPTTPDRVEHYFRRHAPHARDTVLAAYPGYPRRRAAVAVGADVMFAAPTWAFADAYSAHAPTYLYRFEHAPPALRALGLGATHGSEIVHIQHTYASYPGRRLHPLGARRTPAVGRRMQRAWLAFATDGHPGSDWPRYDTGRRRTRLIRTGEDLVADDPDVVRRTAWQGVY